MTVTGGVDADRLRAFIARIEKLEQEKAAIAADIRDVYAEMKSAGYDVKTTRAIVKLRKIEADDRREQEELLDLYKHALGMLADLPLGEAAIEREVSPVRKATKRMQAARPDGEPTVSINGKGSIPLGQFMTIANSLESPIGRAVAAGFIAGAKLDQQKAAETPHDPTTGEVLGDAQAPSPDAPMVSIDGQEPMPIATFAAIVNSKAEQTAARPPLRTLPPRTPEPAPVMPDLPAFLDRRNERTEAAAE